MRFTAVSDEYTKGEKIFVPEATPLSTVIEQTIGNESFDRRLYPDLYAHSVAAAVENFFSERLRAMADEWDQRALNAESSIGSGENDRLLDYAATMRRRADDLRRVV